MRQRANRGVIDLRGWQEKKTPQSGVELLPHSFSFYLFTISHYPYAKSSYS